MYKTTNRRRGRALTENDFASRRVGVPPRPPQFSADPTVARTVRLTQGFVTAAGVYTINIRYLDVVAQDYGDYGGSAARFQYVRVAKFALWASNDAQTAGISTLQLSDGVTIGQQSIFEGTSSSATEWACVGFKPGIQERQAWNSNSSSNACCVITINTVGAVNTGHWVLDVLLEGR